MEACSMEDLTVHFAPMSEEDILDSRSYRHVSTDDFANLFKTGALLRTTQLTVNTYKRRIQNKIFLTLPYILSNMPCLTSLIIEHLHEDSRSKSDFDFSRLPKVISGTLRSLEVRDCGATDVLSFLSLFSECPIDELDVDADTPCLKGLSEYFPELRTLTYYLCEDLEVLFTPKANGEFALPKLEDVTFWGFDSGTCFVIDDAVKGLQARDRNLILQIAIVRLFAPGSVPLKRICIDTRIIDGQEYLDDLHEADFAKELGKYVPVIDWMEMSN